MKEYEVTAYYSAIIRVTAQSEDEAIIKANEQLKNINSIPIIDNFEVEEIED